MQEWQRREREKRERLDAFPECNGVEKVMTELESVRVSSRRVAAGRAECCAVSGRTNDCNSVNALGAISRRVTKQMLKLVVEVQYTTARLDALG